MSEWDDHTVDRLFASYRDAFERGDAQAVADHFAYPAHVTSEGEGIELLPAADEEEWKRQIGRLLDVYREGGRVVRIAALAHNELPRLRAQLAVHP